MEQDLCRLFWPFFIDVRAPRLWTFVSSEIPWNEKTSLEETFLIQINSFGCIIFKPFVKLMDKKNKFLNCVICYFQLSKIIIITNVDY